MKKSLVFIIVSLIVVGVIFLSMTAMAQEKITGDNPQATSTPTPAPVGDKPVVNEQVVIAQINGEPVYLAELKEIWDNMPENYRSQFPGGFKDLLEQWIRQILLVQEAKKQNLPADPDVIKKVESVSRQVLIQELVNREIVKKVTVSDEEIEKEYMANPTPYTDPERVKARHIMVNSKEEADAVLKMIKDGKPFEEVAKEKSQSPDAQNGGEMGYIKKGDLDPEMEKVIFELAPGNVSSAIKTDYGFHVFLVEEHLQPKLKDLAEVKEEIKTSLLPKKQQESFEKMVGELKNKSEIAIMEENLPKEETKPATTPGITQPSPVSQPSPSPETK